MLSRPVWGDKSIPLEKPTDFRVTVSGKEYDVVPTSKSVNQHTTGVSVPGYYINPNDTIGCRPVYVSTDDTSLPQILPLPGNLLDRSFECQQPVWKTNCL